MPKPPRKRPHMVRHRRTLNPDEVALLRRVLMRGCHDRGMTWKQIAPLFRCDESTCRLEVARLHPGDLDTELARDVLEQFARGPGWTAELVVGQAGAG